MKKIRPNTELLCLGTVNEGMQLEVYSVFDGLAHSLATIVADDKDESLWFEVYVGDKAVQIPLSVIKEAIDAAADEVHSESWCDSNILNDGNS